MLSTRTIRLHFHTIFVAVLEPKQPSSTQMLSGYAYHKDFHAGLNMYVHNFPNLDDLLLLAEVLNGPLFSEILHIEN